MCSICFLNLLIYLFLTTMHPLWYCWNHSIFDTRVWKHRGLLNNRIPFELEAVPWKVGNQFEAKCDWEFFSSTHKAITSFVRQFHLLVWVLWNLPKITFLDKAMGKDRKPNSLDFKVVQVCNLFLHNLWL